MSGIRKIAVLGADGTMGPLSGGIFAQAGITCIFFGLSLKTAKRGIENAVRQARSDVLRQYIIPKTYEDFEKELPHCDWILEAVSEDLQLKQKFFQRVDAHRKKGSVVSTISSSLSLEDMAGECSEDFKSHFVGTHFFNPPDKLIANELTFHPKNSPKFRAFIENFCDRVLRRENIVTYNKPGFAANRIGFQYLNEAARYAEKHGVEKIDYLLGPYTGRALSPLATIDLVGIDVHREIVNNIYEQVHDERHESLLLPGYVQKMVDSKLLGKKSGEKGGFYRCGTNNEKLVIQPHTFEYKKIRKMKNDAVENMKFHIHDGEYRKALELFKRVESEEISIVKHFILGYISYSFFRIGEVTPSEMGIHGIDRALAYGFSWLPPSAWVDYLGGPKETMKLLEKSSIPVPEQLKGMPEARLCRIPEVTKYFIAR